MVEPAARKIAFVVQEDPRIADVIRPDLENIGYDIDSVHTLNAAMERLKDQTFRPDLFIIGRHFPDGDGLSFARRQRRPGIPVVFLTAEELSQNVASSLNSVVLRKPFNAPQLIQAIQSAIEITERNRR